jgi:hypothetical protein
MYCNVLRQLIQPFLEILKALKKPVSVFCVVMSTHLEENTNAWEKYAVSILKVPNVWRLPTSKHDIASRKTD